MNSRNKLCTCGSGKKFKDCCEVVKLTRINEAIEGDFVLLKQDILKFAMINYEENIEGCINEFFSEVIVHDEELLDKVSFLLMLWIIFSLPIAENRQTILQSYIKKYRKKIIRPALKEAIIDWQGAVPSIYNVLKDEHNVLYVEDIFTKEESQIHLIREFSTFNSIEGLYVLGTVIKYRNRLFFFATFYVISDQNIISEILKLYNLYSDDIQPKQFIDDLYPEIIEIICYQSIDPDSIPWDTKQQKDVIDLVKANFHLPSSIQKTVENLATTLWKLYCDKTGGRIRNISKYAAALHYIVGYFFIFFDEVDPTKEELADLYGVKKKTLGNTINTLQDVLDDDIDNLLDELSFGYEDDFSGEFEYMEKNFEIDELAQKRAQKQKVKK